MDSRSKNYRLVLVYKLLFDALFLLLLVLAGLLAAEALIPGYLSGYLSFTKIIFLIFANLLLIFYFHKKIGTDEKIETQKKPGKYFSIGLAVFIVLLMAGSLLKFSWLGIAIIISATLASFYYFYNIVFKNN